MDYTLGTNEIGKENGTNFTIKSADCRITFNDRRERILRMDLVLDEETFIKPQETIKDNSNNSLK